jgi:hypothetical protein
MIQQYSWEGQVYNKIDKMADAVLILRCPWQWTKHRPPPSFRDSPGQVPLKIVQPPPQISVEATLKASGADAVYYGTQMRGGSEGQSKTRTELSAAAIGVDH